MAVLSADLAVWGRLATSVRRYASGMATTTVEIDSELLGRLRARDPGKDDRALLEDLARVKLGFEALRESQRRNAVDEDGAMAQAVQAVREIRAARG